MQWLTALLAFATTMLIFSIIVSTLVEMIHRIFGLRSKGLRLMLQNLYDRVIEPRLQVADKLKAADAKPVAADETSGTTKDKAKEKTAANKFADIIMENRALPPEGSDPKRGVFSKFLHWLVESSMMTDIPVEVFTQKLADNRIVAAADTVAEDVVKDIAQKYEAFGNEASAYFERRARLFSVVLAFVVAWMFYVQPYELVVTYIKDPDLAQNVAAQNVKTSNEYQALTAKLDSLSPNLGTNDAKDTKDLEDAIGGLEAAIKDANKKNTELANLGAPVGWPGASDHLETCGWTFWMGPAAVDPVAKKESDDANAAEKGPDDPNYVRDLTKFCRAELNLGFAKPSFVLPTIANAFWLLVGGLLVGLGAPFWAQAVSSLTATRDVSRRIAEIVTPGKSAAADGSVLESLALAPPKTPTSVATFRISGTAEKAVAAKKAIEDAANKAAKDDAGKTTEVVVVPAAKKGRRRLQK